MDKIQVLLIYTRICTCIFGQYIESLIKFNTAEIRLSLQDFSVLVSRGDPGT